LPLERDGRQFVRLADVPGVTYAVAQPIAGRYQVAGLFALGETSLLLDATDLRTGFCVLVKALRWDAGSARVEGAEVRRLRHGLQTERRLLVRLRNAGCNAVPHPNDYVFDRNPAVELASLEREVLDREPFLVLQKLSGVTLERLLREDFPRGMDQQRAIALLLPIVRVLERLHESWELHSGRRWHCVYQDLKPANILIDRLGRSSLIDFGGCQVVVDGVPVLEGACTPGYAPPECSGPARVLLPCADVYAIGATLYHILTGMDPCALPYGIELAALRVTDSLRDLVASCVSPRPSDRPADARRVRMALEPLVQP
jgi:serine/threonine-protein kinase